MSKIDKEYALNLWEKRYGEKIVINDCFGAEIHKDNYGDYCKKNELVFDESLTHNKYGWSIDHIYPSSLNGSDDEDNLEIMSSNNNSVKGDNLEFEINGKSYKVIRIGKNKGYIIDNDNKKISY